MLAAWDSRPKSWPGFRPTCCASTSQAARSLRRCRSCARPTAARSRTRSSTSAVTSGVWLRQVIESGQHSRPLSAEGKKQLLARLTVVDTLERFLHKAYLGQKRFSIEGLDMTVPMLDFTVELAAAHGTRKTVIAMAHRGRLNVLAHVVNVPYETILAEFEGGRKEETPENEG